MGNPKLIEIFTVNETLLSKLVSDLSLTDPEQNFQIKVEAIRSPDSHIYISAIRFRAPSSDIYNYFNIGVQEKGRELHSCSKPEERSHIMYV